MSEHPELQIVMKDETTFSARFDGLEMGILRITEPDSDQFGEINENDVVCLPVNDIAYFIVKDDDSSARPIGWSPS